SSQYSERRVEQVNAAGRALEQISQAMQQLVALNASIASATTQQSTVVEDVNRNVTEAAVLAQETTEGAQQTAEASQHLARIGEQISALLARFRICSHRGCRHRAGSPSFLRSVLQLAQLLDIDIHQQQVAPLVNEQSGSHALAVAAGVPVATGQQYPAVLPRGRQNAVEIGSPGPVVVQIARVLPPALAGPFVVG